MRKLRLFFSSLRIHSSAAPTLQSAIRQHTLHKPLLTNPLASTAAIYPLCQGPFQFDLAHVDPHKGLNLFRHISRAATLVWLVTAELQLHPPARSLSSYVQKQKRHVLSWLLPTHFLYQRCSALSL